MAERPAMGIALWGLGPHAFKNVLPAIAASPDVDLVGVCSRTPRKREEAAGRWGGTSWSDPGEMLESPDVQVVYVATPTGLHVEHGVAVLSAGRHLICEKSLAANFADAERLVRSARERTLVLCEAMMFRHHPRFHVIRETVQSTAFGMPAHAFCCFTLPPLDNPGFRNDPRLGGGALLDIGCYPLAMMIGLFGDEVDVERAVVASGGSSESDRSGSARLRFESGVRADVVWSYDRAYAADLIVLGERQTLSASRVFAKDIRADDRLILRDRFGAATKTRIPEGNGFVNMFADAVAAAGDSRKRESLAGEAETRARLLAAVSERAGVAS